MHDDVSGIVPIPVILERKTGFFVWPSESATVSANDARAQCVAEYLRDALSLWCAISVQVVPLDEAPACTVALRLESAVPELAEQPCAHEGYTLSISDGGVVVAAESAAGLFYGTQSLLQLLPWSNAAPVLLPALHVTDYPTCSWRGTLLDVGRHVFSVAFIKKLLDLLALHKINRFHWHLTEDQGWRLQVNSLPRLTEFGAFRGAGRDRYGGFYTQADVGEVVAYAAARFIEVVPEIELPGHCGAALACYPQLSCTGGVTEVPTQWGVQTDVYCAGKEETFEFLERVLEEVVQLFPGRYVHIGGDECPKVRWSECELCQQRIEQEGLADETALQTWFIDRVARFLQARGRVVIGWDEILEGGIPEEAVVMSWRGTSGGVAAARQKHQVVMCPNTRCYFDYRQSASMQEPGTWYAMLPLEWVYTFEPRGALGGCDASPATVSATPGSSCSAFVDATPSPPHAMSTLADVLEDDDPATQVDGRADACHRAAIATGDIGMLTSDDVDCSGTMETSSAQPTCNSLSLNGAQVDGAALDEPGAGLGDALPMHGLEGGASGKGEKRASDANEDFRQFIIGGQANLWTEFISDEATAEYMLLPRLCALAECVWSPPRRKDWRSFTARTQRLLDRLQHAGYNFRPLSSSAAATSPAAPCSPR